MKMLHNGKWVGFILVWIVFIGLMNSWTVLGEGERNEALNREKILYDYIEKKAEEYYIAPIDARLDPVWHAIPGYNGLEVDVEKTLEWALKRSFRRVEDVPFFYREIEPKVQLDDLGAHPIYRGNPNKKMVSLMINVAWGNEYIPKMLQVLEQENTKATFFLDGSWLQKNKATALQIAQHGHELANHAYSHKNMSTLNEQAQREEIVKTERLLKELQIQNRLFAPPSGDYNEQTVRIAHELQLKTILWTLDTVDWRNPSPEVVLQRILQNLHPGSLILMHPTYASSEALQRMIQGIRKQGYAIGSVSELISSQRIAQDPLFI